MLTRTDLESYRSISGLNLGQIEKDYLQHLVLSLISRATGDELVFKGGTCLQKAFGLDRFSEDLDFTLTRSTNIDALSSSFVRGLRAFGYEASIEVKRKKDSHSLRLKIQGPLFQGTDRSLCSLHMEISVREKVLLEPENKSLYPIYDDLPPYSLLIMDKKEILGEKMRALVTRDRARDLYDIHFLLKKNTEVDWEIVQKKMKYYKRTIDIIEVSEAIKAKKSSWEREIPSLTSSVLSFEEVKGYVLKKIGR